MADKNQKVQWEHPQSEEKILKSLVDFLYAVPPASQQGPANDRYAPHIPSLQMEEELERTFWCYPKLRNIRLGQCLDSYVSHTAQNIECSNCTGCSQGEWNRRCFARS